MAPTNIVADKHKRFGVRMFSAKEMAFNILGLMHPLLFSITQVEPIWAWTACQTLPISLNGSVPSSTGKPTFIASDWQG